jgi:formate dehydrogenase subunit gamma
MNDLWFDTTTWLVWLAPFVGIFAAAFTKRQDPKIEGDKVLRHDKAAITEHWTHGIGTAVLLLSGIVLGLRFLPLSLVTSGANARLWMNVHFVAVIVFLFGTFYYGANTLLARYRFQEHLPTKNFWQFTKQHYGKLLGFKFDMPAEDKYFESEKMAYVLALVATITIIVTGLVKVTAHMVSLPGALMGAVTIIHDVATVAMLAFFLAHVLFAAILPMSWPVLRSMFTGYVARDYAEHEHAGWYRRLKAAQSTSPARKDKAA